MNEELFERIEKELEKPLDDRARAVYLEDSTSSIIRALWHLYVEQPQTHEEANDRMLTPLAACIARTLGDQFKNSEISLYLASKYASVLLLNKEEMEEFLEASSFEAWMERAIPKMCPHDDVANAAFLAAWRGWQPRLTKLSVNLVSSVRDVYQEFILWLRQHPTALDKIAWEAFERLVAEIFASRGFSVDLTGRVRNKSADIIAIRTDEFGVQTKYLIECKRYKDSNRIGLDVANAVLGAKCRASADHAFLVTTTFFTQDMEREKQKFEDLRLHLRDGNDVKEWLRDYTVRSDGGLWLAPEWDLDSGKTDGGIAR